MDSNGKTFLLILLLCFLVPSCYTAWTQPSSHRSMHISFEKWTYNHGRLYKTAEERQKRFNIFRDNVEYIEQHNNNRTNTYRLGINAFTDLTHEEFIARYAGGNRPRRLPSYFANEKRKQVLLAEPPPSLDWREKGVVSPIKNQGQCGSCWAFSAVAAIEGISAIESGVLLPLSEQEIVDCDTTSLQCDGGNMFAAFDYVTQNNGLASESDYPYLASPGACEDKSVPSSLQVKLASYTRVQPYDETALLIAVAQQPVSVAIDPIRLQLYAGGVITGECGAELRHAVTAVGYGTSEDGIKFWLFKNSWGDTWGENGYLRVERDSGVREGMCGVATDMTYPVTSGAAI